MNVTRCKCPVVFLVLLTGAAHLSAQEWEKSRQFKAPEAFQAAAADHDYVYAIDSKKIAKHDRKSEEIIAISQGEAQHLNSGFLWRGNLYCAHSNSTHYSEDSKPSERSQIRLLDVESMQLTTFKDFGDLGGSLTWAVHHDDHWWCNFAQYFDEKGKTFLAKFDTNWVEQARWTYPDQVLKRLGRNSISGGVWRGNELLVTGHHDPVLFRLKLPDAGNELAYVGEYQVPFSGQGIALDPKSGGMVGIIRAYLGRSQIVFASPPRLTQIDENLRHVQREAPASGYADSSAAPVSDFEDPQTSVCYDLSEPCCECELRRGIIGRCRARVAAHRK